MKTYFPLSLRCQTWDTSVKSLACFHRAFVKSVLLMRQQLTNTPRGSFQSVQHSTPSVFWPRSSTSTDSPKSSDSEGRPNEFMSISLPEQHEETIMMTERLTRLRNLVRKDTSKLSMLLFGISLFLLMKKNVHKITVLLANVKKWLIDNYMVCALTDIPESLWKVWVSERRNPLNYGFI